MIPPRSRLQHLIPAWLTVPIAASLLATTAAAEPDSFNDEIRPILREHCAACHGGVKAAGGVSFVRREGAMQGAESGIPTIVPGKPDASELIRRVTSQDEFERMPPPEHGDALTGEELAALRKWIEAGAQWSELWSLEPLSEPRPAAVDPSGWARQSLDGFVLAAMKQHGLEPSPQAGPAEWLRRVTLDLTGLPPTVEAFDRFAASFIVDSQAAKAAAVDRLLASPQFGERWATMWLDLARYSDTYGYEKDASRTIWPWRDWVVRSFNADMPFDDFTVKQLAGDLLPDATSDDILATAFHRNTQNNTEGGTDDEEFRMAAVIDRVDTTWTTWQGTTFGCVRCHSHPYDPYPQADYYRFAALFNTTEDRDQNDDFPLYAVATDPARRDEAAGLQRKISELRRVHNESGVEVAERVDDWSAIVPGAADSSGGELQIDDDGRITASGTLPVGVRYTLRATLPAGTTALRLEINRETDDPAAPPERGSVLSHVRLARADGDASGEVKIADVVADYISGPYDPRDSLTDDAAGFGSYPVLTEPRWAVFVLEQPLTESAEVELLLHQKAASNSGTQASTLRNFSLQSSVDDRWANWSSDSKRRDTLAELEAAKQKLAAIDAVKVPVLVAQSERAKRTTHVAIRGNRLDLAQAVEPGLPQVIAGEAADDCADRLAMARWLVGPDNPLAARVLANRLWAELFGVGIVATLEDFGTSGAEPSHPELLDHLAWQLMDRDGWSIKAYLRTIVLSSSYGQTAKARRDAIAADPQNTWLSRGPRVRLSAEMVRDQALRVSGRFAAELYGPPVFPPQPEGVWRPVYNGAKWETSGGANGFRRGLYTFHRRTSGYPGFLIFDAPSRELCTPRRLATNTPLQALVTLNDAAFIELAAAMAMRMKSAGDTVDEQIAAGLQLLTLEQPPEAMVGRLVRLHGEAVAAYEADPAAAKELAGEPRDAAMVLVANTILNMDAFLNR